MLKRLLIFWRGVLARTWYVHDPIVLLFYAPPSACLQMMKAAAKPSTQRLHLRNLFAEGRRYHIDATRQGFRMITTSKHAFRYRRRTAATAILRGEIDPMGDGTRMRLSARINAGYLLDVFLIPTFMASLVIFMPWPPRLVAALIVALYTLSWFGHRYNARLEANEMVWFVRKSLEDVLAPEPLALSPRTLNVIDTGQGFESAWDAFLRQQIPDEPTMPDED